MLSLNRKTIVDLNQMLIDDGLNNPSIPLTDPATENQSADVRVYFRDIEERLIEHIERAELVVGCVAWFTHRRIIRALAEVPQGVAIVVQKEDFLRPDTDPGNQWRLRLRELYESLRMPHSRYWLGELISRLSQGGNQAMEAVRCVGNHNRDRKPAFPRMHHKFLVFCEAPDDSPRPYEVWTGSFNISANAANSLENAVVIRDEKIARAYYREWEQIEAISEPLDWESDWCAPQWRIGS